MDAEDMKGMTSENGEFALTGDVDAEPMDDDTILVSGEMGFTAIMSTKAFAKVAHEYRKLNAVVEDVDPVLADTGAQE